MAEVMITAVVLAFVIMGSLTALSRSYAFTRHARMVTLAGQVVQSVMEDLRLKSFADLQAYAVQSQPVNFNGKLATEGFSSAFTQGFNLSCNFTTLVASAAPTLGKISATVTVSWTEAGNPYQRTLITYFGEKGLSDYYFAGWAPN